MIPYLLAVFLFVGLTSVTVLGQGCGVQTAPLNPDESGINIVGGKPAQEGEWPWQAFIQHGDTTYGGVLVDPQWVLTWPAENGVNDVIVSMGSIKINNPSSHLQQRTITLRVTHPNNNGNDYRVSLLKLSSPFTINDYVRTVCLPDPSTITFPSGSSCIAAGWGYTSESGTDFSNELLEVEVEVEQMNYCRQQYPDYTITNRMICAGGEAGKGTCHGDGPLVSMIKSRWYAVGVPNFSEGCGKENYPAVYTSAAAMYGWIRTVIDDKPGGSSSHVVSSRLLILNAAAIAIVLQFFK